MANRRREAKAPPAMQPGQRRAADPGWWLMRFDGGCPMNGMPGATGTWAFTLDDAAGRRVGQGSGSATGSPVSCNTAEWEGCYEGIRAAVEAKPPGLIVQGDSQLIIFQLAGFWKCKKPHLEAWRAKAANLLIGSGIPWTARHVFREHNAECDAMAALAAKAREA